MTFPLDEFDRAAEPDDEPRLSRLPAVLILAVAVVIAGVVGMVAVPALRAMHDDRPRGTAQAAPPPVPITDTPSDYVTPSEDVSVTPTPSPSTPRASGTPTPAPPPAHVTPPAGPPPVIPPPTHADPTTPPPPVGCAGCVLPGDGTVLIGGVGPKGAAAGRYHSEGASRAGGCSWWVATNPQGADANHGTGNDVTVRNGSWFHSDGCQVWHWVGAP